VNRRAQTVERQDAPLPRAEDLNRLPVVAIVGRPNTGKSTLFNRLTRTRRALVAAIPGVTRDRNLGVAEHEGRRYLAVDTGGFEAVDDGDLAAAVRAQAMLAAEEADAVIVVVDGRAGASPFDRMLVERLRALRQPIFLAINKLDRPSHEELVGDFYQLGLERLYPISAEHGLNVDRLLDDVFEHLPVSESPPSADGAPPVSVAIIGRPNVGKSSLLNRLVGYDRAIVTPIPGTTRDAIDTPVSHGGRAYLLVDTAGVRRRGRVSAHVERASVVRALRALVRAEVALLVVDAAGGMTEQDARIGGYAWERGRALVLVINKWDAVEPERRERAAFAEKIDRHYPSLVTVPKLFVSALKGQGVERIWQAVDDVIATHRARIATPRLNDVVQRAVAERPPPAPRGKRTRFYYAAQTATAPVTVTIVCSEPTQVPEAYERYLTNQIRAAFGLEGTPLRVRLRKREHARTGAKKSRAAPTRKRRGRPR
jgi:GTP-binding protein